MCFSLWKIAFLALEKGLLTDNGLISAEENNFEVAKQMIMSLV